MGEKMIDVSHHQGKIDWKKVANAGIKGTYIKATEGSEDGHAFLDEQMAENFKQANANGLEIGFYHYAKFVDKKDAKAEADWFVKNIKGKKFTMPPMLDLEENNAGTNKEMNKGAKAFLKRVEKKLGSAGLYSFGNFYAENVDKKLAKRYAYWHARYAEKPVNVKLKNVYMWQYSSEGSIDGIGGPVDHNETGGKFFTVNKKKRDKKAGNKASSSSKKKKSNKKKKKEPKQTNYTVKKGDMLSEIAQDHNTTTKQLRNLNKIKNADNIHVGQKIKLKGNKKKASKTTTYKIKSGDTLSGIAQGYNTTTAKLKNLNNIKNADAIQAGQTIKIKGGKAKANKKYYTVKSGDTLSEIAQKYSTKTDTLKKWNGIKNANQIKQDQKLRVK